MPHSYNDIYDWAIKSFCGWAYPHAPKTTGAMVLVFKNQKEDTDAPSAQISNAIDANRAKNVNDTPMYQALLRCDEKSALVQPLTLSVSGVAEPALYAVKDYVCPTALYYDIGTSVFHMIQKRLHQDDKRLEAKSFKDIEEFIFKLPLLDDNLQRTLAGIMYTETLVQFSMADSGLRFKDRAATKLSIAERNKLLWDFCRQLIAMGVAT